MNSVLFYKVMSGFYDLLDVIYFRKYESSPRKVVNERTHTRKYLGVVLDINEYKYYIPLSSPKITDYEDKEGVLTIRKDSFIIWRIVSTKKGIEELKATIRFAGMIPVPDSELELYDIENEKDENYKNLVQEEMEYIRKKDVKIENRAKTIYKKKIQNEESTNIQKCLDFKDLELMHDIWVNNIKQQ